MFIALKRSKNSNYHQTANHCNKVDFVSGSKAMQQPVHIWVRVYMVICRAMERWIVWRGRGRVRAYPILTTSLKIAERLIARKLHMAPESRFPVIYIHPWRTTDMRVLVLNISQFYSATANSFIFIPQFLSFLHHQLAFSMPLRLMHLTGCIQHISHYRSSCR